MHLPPLSFFQHSSCFVLICSFFRLLQALDPARLPNAVAVSARHDVEVELLAARADRPRRFNDDVVLARGNHLCVRVFQHDEGAAVALHGDDVVTGDIARLVQIQRELILGVERPAGRNRVRLGDNAANLRALLRAGAICQRRRGRNAQEQHHHAHHQCQHAGKQLLHGHKPVLLILHEPFSVLEVVLLRLRVEYNMAESDCQ